MAHEIGIGTHGRASMAYVGETPWHRLGTKLPGKFMKSREAMLAAGMDYDAELEDMVTVSGLCVPRARAVVRSDTRKVLGVVGPQYQPIQNRECFAFLDSLVADGQLQYHTVGALGEGERVWMLAKLPGNLRVGKTDDILRKYLLLSSSHDGSSLLWTWMTSVRVVCANTLRAAVGERGAKNGISIRHSGNITDKIHEAQDVLGLARKHYDDLEGQFTQLASYRLSDTARLAYFKTLYPDKVAKGGELSSRTKNIQDKLVELAETGRGTDIPGVKGTAWGALNAVTEFVDHYRSTRGATPEAERENRLDSIWFGSGADLKTKAYGEILAVAGLN